MKSFKPKPKPVIRPGDKPKSNPKPKPGQNPIYETPIYNTKPGRRTPPNPGFDPRPRPIGRRTPPQLGNVGYPVYATKPGIIYKPSTSKKRAM